MSLMWYWWDLVAQLGWCWCWCLSGEGVEGREEQEKRGLAEAEGTDGSIGCNGHSRWVVTAEKNSGDPRTSRSVTMDTLPGVSSDVEECVCVWVFVCAGGQRSRGKRGGNQDGHV